MRSTIDNPAPPGQPLGLRLIIAYKFVKGPAMLALAAALTFARIPADHLLRHLVAELSEWGLLGWRFAQIRQKPGTALARCPRRAFPSAY